MPPKRTPPALPVPGVMSGAPAPPGIPPGAGSLLPPTPSAHASGASRPAARPPSAVPIGERAAAVLALAYRANRAVLLEGPTGIGKSELVKQVADELGIGFAVLDLSLLEPPDLVGLPV